MKNIKGFWGGALFVGANSAEGFVSYYKDVTEGAKKIYILKGGPGTGKSSFLRAASKCAASKGRKVEIYRCSSDPTSLDAIVVDGELVILDGTAPHTVDTVLAGARDEIINLGDFWQSDKLTERYEEIERLSCEKGELYRLAYRYLAASKSVRAVNSALVLPVFKAEKAEGAVRRLFSEIKTGGGFSARTAVISSVGMKGRVRLDTYERFAERVYSVEDHFGTGELFMRLLYDHAKRSETPIRVSFDPIEKERIDAIFLPNDRKAFVLVDKGSDVEGRTRINMQRFVDAKAAAKIRHEYKTNAHICDSLVTSAIEAMRKAGEKHFALEGIYTSCMDFAAMERFSRAKLHAIFGE